MDRDRPPSSETVDPEVERRVTGVADGADLSAVAAALSASRQAILGRWLDVTSRQPFHHERPDAAVADHIPVLFDAIVDLLRRGAAADRDVDAPADDPAIADAATAHAQVRFEQGLGPVAVVTEFRLLRQEVGRAMARMLDDAVPAADVVGGLAVVSDALDGASSVGLTALSDRIEDVRESFLATTLHDVRQPITLVEGSLHLADRWLLAGDDSQRVHEAIGDAMTAADELRAMIDTLSDASQVALGELRSDPEPASLEEIVATSVAAFGANARRRVTVTVPSRGHLIGMWDVRLLHRVVANLVGNALKYSGPDGPVEVIVQPGEAGFATLIVADQGLGMTPEELDRIFERFARADRARDQGIPGLGLGLYACRGIVRAHGGSIEVRSDGVQRGTRVVVHLPLLAEDAGAEGED